MSSVLRMTQAAIIVRVLFWAIGWFGGSFWLSGRFVVRGLVIGRGDSCRKPTISECIQVKYFAGQHTTFYRDFNYI
ncbi:hypothetical protein BDV38DRAFT_246141 [Aspergillus pseudotamarii]|uniref:Uncharacterized protein n=1 Tax=Aspergillus pseudotamarii TaxID=132259 RepID=A0A5N6SVH3_ASPPS|nr:uncharacterized protein BDV38DRAFT_246141 [Aspergillus pseudotamarii]KAE8137740.1 hypothetical protein BDV38DRAFT_246141 [Aspergillus pseudotamarii]